MDFTLFLKGLIIGLSIAAPVGPIGVLCISRTLAEGRLYGIASGLGAATADAVYGCVAVLGLTIVSNSLVQQQAWIRLIGGLFLCILGIKLFLAKPAKRGPLASRSGLAGAYASTFFLTLTNPMTILFFAAIIAGLSPADATENTMSAGTVVMGVFIGSSLWWLILSGSVGAFRERLDLQRMQWVNRISGAIIAGFGLSALLSSA